MAVTNYYTVYGEIIGEHTTGQSRLDYLCDALGSVVSTVDQTQTVKSTARYKPYGADLATTGPQPVYGWVGSFGSRKTGRPHSEIYNQARHLGCAAGRWTTVDPIWPFQMAYVYVLDSPVTTIDPSGLDPCPCRKHVQNVVWNSMGAWINESAINDCYTKACDLNYNIEGPSSSVTWSYSTFWDCISDKYTYYNSLAGGLSGVIGGLKTFSYGNCCGLYQKCNGEASQGIDCIDKACSKHDQCCSNLGRWLLADCNKKICSSAYACLQGGCQADVGRSSFQKKQCMSAANQIMLAFCGITFLKVNIK